jgi:DNA-binding NtrC family response regulator
VDSKPGHGTVFKIHLPRAHAPEAEESREQAGPSLEGKETVLLVEDEAGILALGQSILARYGYTVLAARTTKDALEKAKGYAGPIDLLVTDVVMPGLNGNGLSQAITALRPGIKTLYMSGYTADVIANHGVLAEGVHYLQKPFSIQEMAAKVRQVLDGGQ